MISYEPSASRKQPVVAHLTTEAEYSFYPDARSYIVSAVYRFTRSKHEKGDCEATLLVVEYPMQKLARGSPCKQASYRSPNRVSWAAVHLRSYILVHTYNNNRLPTDPELSDSLIIQL